MARTTSVTIGDQLTDFVKKMIENGRYGSASEVIRSALRLLEQKEMEMDALRKAIELGELSGESTLSLQEIAAQNKRELNVQTVKSGCG
ncbi:type II toxin-antitoxin system ParD family antitoxin [Erwinia sp. AnSW2-5]|uniref:type II toxin-antitoxin system ParD family antitoxin n=1 Tax=Erwinia sp. AnSW2-5 TaxID=3367692 RepID=UPI00385C3AE2